MPGKFAKKSTRRGLVKALGGSAIFVAVTASAVAQQVPAPATPPPPTATQAIDHQSSLTVQQIVARQEDHFATIKNAQGTVVHTETHFNDQGQPSAPVKQYIFFAYAGDRSVTLSMPENAARFYRSSQGRIPWKDITAAYHVTGDTVYAIRKPENGTTAPTVIAVPFNPAIHENNPLVRFHPRQISDEQIPLRDLARAIPRMAHRPTVSDITFDGKPMARINFSNPNAPTENLYYIIDPARGYLPVEIARMSGSRPISVSKIVIGHTPDGTWIPARRERTMYGANGKPVSRQEWHYDFLAVNKGLAPKTLSLMYFNLPLNTKIEVVGGNPMAPRGNAATATSNKTPRQNPAIAPGSTPAPARAVATPIRVPLK